MSSTGLFIISLLVGLQYSAVQAAATSKRTTTVKTTLTQKGYRDCQQIYESGQTTSGVYQISLSNNTTIKVYCEMELDKGGWTVFQRRVDGSEDFFRTWNDYKVGFGNITNEFWMGNQNLYLMTANHDQKLKIELDYKGKVAYADYSSFWVDDENYYYTLNVAGYFGADPPGDSLIPLWHNGCSFSTKDADHDGNSGNCATEDRFGGWWYNNVCGYTNLNGLYNGNTVSGMFWYSYEGLRGMTATRMMIKRN